MQVHDPLAPGASDATTRSSRVASIAVIAAAVLVLDQITKIWAASALSDRSIHVVWKLHLRLVRNPGTAFSLGEGKGPLLGVVACVVVLVLCRLARQPRTLVSAVGIGLILGGAVGTWSTESCAAPTGS